MGSRVSVFNPARCRRSTRSPDEASALTFLLSVTARVTARAVSNRDRDSRHTADSRDNTADNSTGKGGSSMDTVGTHTRRSTRRSRRSSPDADSGVYILQ